MEYRILAIAIGYHRLCKNYELTPNGHLDAYLADLAAHGVTILRLMLEYAHTDGRYFERPVGQFNPAIVRLWDDLFARCEAHGLRVLLAPWDNFWMSRRWHRHPYNKVNGGPADGSHSFFTDEATIAATVRRLEFVARRWGGSGALAAWDLFNEIHPYWGGTAAQQSAVLTRLSDAVRQAESDAWGVTRPQTVSIFGPEPPADYQDLIFRHPSLDFATTHVYQGAIDFPNDTLEPARTMGRWVRYARARTPPDRPYTDTEHGPIHLFNDHKKMLPEAFDDEYERRLMWAHLASGGAGSGLRWPARHPHVLTAGMKRALHSLAGFTPLLDWRTFAPQDATADVRLGIPGADVFACRDAHQAVIWLLRGNEQVEHHVPLTLRGLQPGAYRVTLWDTEAGCARGEFAATVSDAGALNILLPSLGRDLALAVRSVRI